MGLNLELARGAKGGLGIAKSEKFRIEAGFSKTKPGEEDRVLTRQAEVELGDGGCWNRDDATKCQTVRSRPAKGHP